MTVLVLLSVGLTVFQVFFKSQEQLVEDFGAARDIKAGEVIGSESVTRIKIHPSNRIGGNGRVAGMEDLIGKKATVDIPGGAILSRTYFEEPVLAEQLKKGRALTAVKLMPDHAICWVAEIGSFVDIYFISDSGETERLGEVELKKVYDQKLSAEDLLLFAVVEGSESVIEKIMQRRAAGRLEIIKTH